MLNFGGTLIKVVADVTNRVVEEWDYTIDKFNSDLNEHDAFKNVDSCYLELGLHNTHHADGTIDGHVRTIQLVNCGMSCSHYEFKASSREVIKPEITVEWRDQKLCVVIKPRVGAPQGIVSPVTEIVKANTKVVVIGHSFTTINIPEPTLVLLDEAKELLEDFVQKEFVRIQVEQVPGAQMAQTR